MEPTSQWDSKGILYVDLKNTFIIYLLAVTISKKRYMVNVFFNLKELKKTKLGLILFMIHSQKNRTKQSIL